MKGLNFLNFNIFLPLSIVLTSANSADNDEMLHYVTFYHGLYCLPRYPITGIQIEKGSSKHQALNQD